MIFRWFVFNSLGTFVKKTFKISFVESYRRQHLDPADKFNQSVCVHASVLQVDDPSSPNDEGITALHNAVCAGHAEIVKFLVQFGVNANAADSDGW